jgi:hypothetical protein
LAHGRESKRKQLAHLTLLLLTALSVWLSGRDWSWLLRAEILFDLFEGRDQLLFAEIAFELILINNDFQRSATK